MCMCLYDKTTCFCSVQAWTRPINTRLKPGPSPRWLIFFSLGPIWPKKFIRGPNFGPCREIIRIQTYIHTYPSTCVRVRVSETISVSISAPATAMPVEEAKPVLKGTNDKKSTLTHNSFVIQFINAFSNDYGDVVSYSVIVTKSLDDKTSDKRDIPYWSKMKLEKSISTYVAIEQCANLFSDGDKCWKHSRKRRAASTDTSNENKNVAVTMGGDETCDEKTKGACNGKLSPSTAYYVKLRAFTENGLFTDTGFSEAITTGMPVCLHVNIVNICLVLFVITIIKYTPCYHIYIIIITIMPI